jgi:DNA repair protein RecN (Recombination protein N)
VLKSLTVRNLAVVAGGEVELGPGFNVLTGETGAGKSLVVDSLALLGGARAAADLVREGAESLTVAGVFDLTDALAARLETAGFDLEGDDELVVRREIGREGRNRIFVNDRPATLRLLQELAPALLRIHGQREELGLADPELQRAWLDRLGGDAGTRFLAEASRTYGDYRALAERLERLLGDATLRAERLDLLRFQAGEIDQARLTAGEDEALRRERDALRHAEAIVRGLGAAHARLTEDEVSAQEALGAARHELEAIAGWEPLADELATELGELAARTAEAGRALADRLARFEVEPGRLDVVEERLALIERLARKFGADVAGILARREAIARELEELQGGEENREALEVRTGAALEAYRQAALALSAARRGWAADLGQKLERELGDLALGKARVDVALERTPRAGSPLFVDGEAVEFGAAGFDRVVFRFAPNPGEPLLPLVRIASGGELARVALALQLATRGDEEATGPTLVFDEIDAGLGGAQGAAIGRKLRRLARRGQILAVTHLPQVASFGDRHYRVTKKVRGGRTFAEVEALGRGVRVEEIARMLSADKVTAISRDHAGEMLGAAEKERE